MIHRRRWFLAVDDGHQGVVRAWSIRPGTWHRFAEGDRVTARVTRLFGHVEDIGPGGGESEHTLG